MGARLAPDATMAFPRLEDQDFLPRFADACVVVASVALAVAAAIFLHRVLLLVVLGCVLAQLFIAMAEPLAARFPGPHAFWVGVSFVFALAVAAGLLVLLTLPLVDQASALARDLPHRLELVERWLDRISGTPPAERPTVRDEITGRLPAVAASGLPVIVGLLERTFDVLGVVFFGAFVAAAPEAHRRAFVRLFPASLRPRVEAFLGEAGVAIRGWLGAAGTAMAIVAVLVTVGLSLLDVPFWLLFGVLAGGLEIVPWAGPFLGLLGPFLAALGEGEPRKAALVAALFLGVRLLMANLVNPFLVKRRTDVPASLAIASILLLGTAVGALGVLVAVPLVAIALAAARTFVPVTA